MKTQPKPSRQPHTAGELWSISNAMGDTRIVQTDGYGQTIGFVCLMPDEKDWPGAHQRAQLIVSAPDLLAAAETAFNSLELFRLHCGTVEWNEEYTDFARSHTRLQSAIKKAKGL